MALSNLTNRNGYTADGTTATYAYTFPIFLTTDLKVTVRDTGGTETVLTLGTDYTVTGALNLTGGTVVLVNGGQAWLDGNAHLKTGYFIAIRRVRPLTQSTDIRNQGSYYPSTVEDTFDMMVMLAQQLQDQIDRALKTPETDYESYAIPQKAARAGMILGFDLTGAPIAVTPVSGGGALVIALPIYANDAAYVAALGGPSQGALYFNSATGNVRLYNGAAWVNQPTETSTAIFQNKDFQGGVASSTSRITVPGDTFANISALARKAGTILYSTDKKTLFLDTGAALASVGGGGGSSLLWRLVTNAPDETTDLTANALLELLDFNQNDSQAVYAQIQVPSQYVVGTQITLKGGLFACPLTVGNVKFNALVSLLQVAGTTVLGTYNQRNSTNAQVAVAAVANKFTPIGSVDLTDASGQINGVAVQPNDTLLIQFFRDCANETSGAAGLARLVRFGMIPQFN